MRRGKKGNKEKEEWVTGPAGQFDVHGEVFLFHRSGPDTAVEVFFLPHGHADVHDG